MEHQSSSINAFPVSSSNGFPTPTSTLQSLDPPLADRYTGLAHELVAVWPSQEDLKCIYALPVGLATHLHMTICSDLPQASAQEPVSSREMLQLPHPGSHPVLIARKLLQLASLLQGALSTSNMLGSMRVHFREMMSHVFSTAIRLVTTNDDLTICVEGLECIMLETMIHNYSGDLHRAWMTIHRAATVAQMMSLHRGSKSMTSLKFLEPTTKASFDSDECCFVITNMDCYLSVTLGLPRSSFETSVLMPEALASCQPLERLARMQCIIANRLMEQRHKNTPGKQLEDVHEIDQLLQNAAAEMPPQWWLSPDFEPTVDDAKNAFKQVGRVNYQLAHYHLTVRLHLPFLLRSSHDTAYDYSKLTTINTVRDILNLYIAFRKWNGGHFYCRGIDYLVFVAVTTLCVAHVNARCQNATSASNSNIERALKQGRLRDRGIMERALQILQEMKDDAIAAKLSRIMHHLLAVEEDAFNGTQYSTISTDSDVSAATCDGDYVDGNQAYQLRVPSLGIVKLQRSLDCRIGNSGPGVRTDASALHEQTVTPNQACSTACDNQGLDQTLSSVTDFETHDHDARISDILDIPEDWTLQSINDSLFDSLFSGMDGEGSAYGWSNL